MKRLVWDLPLRLFHWLLVISIIASWATAELGFTWMQWHFWLGYWTLGLLIFRLLWGLVGTRHSRFASFIKGPSVVLGYLRASAQADISRVGHNPLGALMVILMLLLIALQVGTGLFATDDITWAGPFNGTVSESLAKQLTGLHHLNFNLIWAAIALHVAAILYYAWVKKKNLVPAMVTGRMAAELVPEGEAITGSQLWKAAIVIAVSGGVVYWILSLAPPASSSMY